MREFTRTDSLSSFDDEGREIFDVDPQGNVTRNVFDSLGRLTERIDPLGRATTYVYDEDSDPELDAAYDFAGRKVSFNHAGSTGNITIVYHDDSGAPYHTDTITFEEDRTIIELAGTKMTLDYGEMGELISVSDEHGWKEDITTVLGQTMVPSMTTAGGTPGILTVHHAVSGADAYHTAQLETTTVDSRGFQTTTWLNRFGDPVRIVDASGDVWQFTYDENGNLGSLRTPDPDSFGASSDQFLTGDGPIENVTTLYGYHPEFGALQSITHPDGMSVNWTYHPEYQLQPSSTMSSIDP